MMSLEQRPRQERVRLVHGRGALALTRFDAQKRVEATPPTSGPQAGRGQGVQSGLGRWVAHQNGALLLLPLPEADTPETTKCSS